MTSNWREVSLTDIYDIHSGLSKPRAEFGFGHGFLTFKDVLDNYFVPVGAVTLVPRNSRGISRFGGREAVYLSNDAV
jgi:type I restriction enzyme S subunit